MTTLIACGLVLTYVFSYSELTLMFRSPGGLATFTEVALGSFLAIVAVMPGYVIVAMFARPAENALIELIQVELVGIELPPAGAVDGHSGVDIFATAQSALSFIMVATMTLLGIIAVAGWGMPRPVEIVTSSVPAFSSCMVSLIALAIWRFVGLEFVCPLVLESKAPNRDVPRAVIIGATIILVMYLRYCWEALRHLPTEVLATSPLPHYDYVQVVLGRSGLLVLTVAAFTATCSTVNTSLAAVPRMIYGMAQNGQTFAVLGRLHPTFGTPWVAILFIAALTALPILIYGVNADAILILLVGAAIAWLVACIIVHIDVIVLRRRHPEIPRPFKTLFYPLPQIIGILGMANAIGHASPSPDLTAKVFTIAGLTLAAGCVWAAIWVRFVMKQRLFEAEPDKLHALLAQ